MKTKWEDNSIQFPRLISELETLGVFTPDVIKGLCLNMDLQSADIVELLDRAQEKWDKIKASL